MVFKNEDDALELHNDAPEQLGFVGAVIGTLVGAVIGVFVPGFLGVALVFVGAIGAGVVGYRIGLLAGNTRVFIDIPGHPDGGVCIRAYNWAIRENWPAVWGSAREM